MTPRERVLAVLRGETPDRVPFTIKRPQPPQGEIERLLRNEGLAADARNVVCGGCWATGVITAMRALIDTIGWLC